MSLLSGATLSLYPVACPERSALFSSVYSRLLMTGLMATVACPLPPGPLMTRVSTGGSGTGYAEG